MTFQWASEWRLTPEVSNGSKKGVQKGSKMAFSRGDFLGRFFSFEKFRPESLRDFQKRQKMTKKRPKKCPHPPKTGPKWVKKGSFLTQKSFVEALF